jgi:hypothetical protein
MSTSFMRLPGNSGPNVLGYCLPVLLNPDTRLRERRPIRPSRGDYHLVSFNINKLS